MLASPAFSETADRPGKRAIALPLVTSKSAPLPPSTFITSRGGDSSVASTVPWPTFRAPRSSPFVHGAPVTSASGVRGSGTGPVEAGAADAVGAVDALAASDAAGADADADALDGARCVHATAKPTVAKASDAVRIPHVYHAPQRRAGRRGILSSGSSAGTCDSRT